MGWKEVWEKYQIAATFAEAGEQKMAMHFLEESSKEQPSPREEEHPVAEEGRTFLRPSHSEG